jgi:hypothetical protein
MQDLLLCEHSDPLPRLSALFFEGDGLCSLI